MYLAAQGDNPFGSTFALLLVLEDTEERGALIKIPGRIDVDETTGQITTVFNDTPQFPFDDLTLKFRRGPRAPWSPTDLRHPDDRGGSRLLRPAPEPRRCLQHL